MSVAMVGTRGVPAHYGGFETCVEEVGARLADRGHRVVVYCRSQRGSEEREHTEYRGMELIQLSAAHKRSLETLSHTALSVAHLARHRTDAAIMFNAANSPLLPVVRTARIPVATHVDGLEWQRGKWGPSGQRYYKKAEKLAVRWSDALIADAKGIAAYYRGTFDAATDLISYGAPEVDRSRSDRLAALELEAGGYHLIVARFEPENHVDVIVDGYVRSGAAKPLIVVGSAPYAHEYTARIQAIGDPDPRVRFLGGIWDQELLDQLYVNAYIYWHGHSVGGTNPSLLRALGTAVDAYDVVFNREVLGDSGRYFRTADDVATLIDAAEADATGTAARAATSLDRAKGYDWDDVAAKYEALCQRLIAARATGG